jgi:hypothetical protein
MAADFPCTQWRTEFCRLIPVRLVCRRAVGELPAHQDVNRFNAVALMQLLDNTPRGRRICPWTYLDKKQLASLPNHQLGFQGPQFAGQPLKARFGICPQRKRADLHEMPTRFDRCGKRRRCHGFCWRTYLNSRNPRGRGRTRRLSRPGCSGRLHWCTTSQQRWFDSQRRQNFRGRRTYSQRKQDEEDTKVEWSATIVGHVGYLCEIGNIRAHVAPAFAR